MKIWLSRLSNLSIRYKLFATYLLVISIPFILLLIIHITLTQKEDEERAIDSSRKMLNETKSYVAYKSEAMTEVLNFLAFNPLVQNGVAADSAPYENIIRWHDEAIVLTQLVNQFLYNKDINSIQIYMEKGLAGATESPDFLQLNKVKSTVWYRDFASTDDFFDWLPTKVLDPGASTGEIAILRKVLDVNNSRKFKGIVQARIESSAMQTVLNHAVLTPNTSSLLFNDRGDLLSSSDHFDYQDTLVTDVLKNTTEHSAREGYYNDDYLIEGKRHLLGVEDIPNTNLKVAIVVPYSDITESTIKARSRIISIFMLVIPLMLPLAYFTAGTATKRIRLLILHARKIKHGNFNITPLPVKGDEIGELTQNFNVMVQNISELIDETYKLGNEVKSNELKALQAQINPHFLYNTLDLINIMAIEADEREIQRVVDELATFYKLSLSNGKEFVTLESELQHIEAYTSIQNIRFGGGIRLELEVTREWYTCEMPKIILQPLVENAILHGIMEKEPEEGIIRVTAWAEQDDLIVQLSDDGIGMEAEELDAIFKGDNRKRKGGGYGVRNIDERLKLAYGASYGLKFESIPKQGTRVYMRIPLKSNRLKV
ncbi:cache domain-containing sensor histidine kinase [Paenibacillus donghaensis]|uniref:histidine kinase n=1 Tax=Paenibacillus donghaensis TaxID=414771 RepID=A0A2Z2K737_9BACL|nr:sensor histidine kinase [Paenibacillus donghaensis]ASA20767.1 two-component sensor histidine kinase [Paenibacillus donghaensis]